MASTGSLERYSVSLNGAIWELPSKADGSSLNDTEVVGIAEALKAVYGDVWVGKTAMNTTDYQLDWTAEPVVFS